MYRIFLPSILSCMLLYISPSVVSAANDVDHFNFFVFTDMHLDTLPNAKPVILNPPANTYKSGDIDNQSFTKLLDKITESNLANTHKPDFIMTLGDINAHNSSLSKGTRQKNLYSAFLKLNQTFPMTPTINVFGNNDSPEKDYGVFSSKGKSPYITLMSQAGWKDGFLSSGSLCSDNQNTAQYPCINIPTEDNKTYGYFSGYLQKGLKLIALNSVLFSSSQYTPSHVGADTELTWLDSELQKSMANNENVILAMHIPVGKGWLDEYSNQFSKIISRVKPGVIAGMLAGHNHMNELRVVRLVDAKRKTLDIFPLIMTPALAPANSNAPGFKEFIMNKVNNKWVVQNIISYSYQQKTAADPINLVEYYKFNEAYCPGEQLSVSECMKKNLFNNGKSIAIKPPASILMGEHYTNGNLNNNQKVSAKSWIRTYEIKLSN